MEKKNIISGKSVFISKLEITTTQIVKNVLIALLILFVILPFFTGFLEVVLGAQTSNFSVFSMYDLKETYGWIDVEESLDPFLVEGKDDLQFYFVSDNEGYMVIIATEKDSNILDEVINYTYALTDQAKPVYLTGKVEKITEDMKLDIIESHNYYFSSEPISLDTYDDTFDKFYLNTTVLPKGNNNTVIIFIIMFLLFVIFFIKKSIGLVRRIIRAKQIKQQYSADALRYIGDQLDAPTNVCIDLYNVYVTLEHLVVCKNRLDIIHLNQIRTLQGDFKGNKFVLDLSLYNNENRSIVLSKQAVNQENYRKVLQIIQDRIDNVGNLATEDMLINESEIKAQQLVSLEKGTDLSITQRILGFIGALIGVGIGGIVWFGIDSLGYIVGYVGILMVFLGMKGYKLCAGRNTKKGFRISLILSIIVIYICNCIPYVEYTLEHYYGQNSLWNIIMSYIRTPQLMFATDNGFTFMFNLILGLVLGIGAGIRLSNSVDSNPEDSNSTVIIDSTSNDNDGSNYENNNNEGNFDNNYNHSYDNHNNNIDSNYDGSDIVTESNSSYDN